MKKNLYLSDRAVEAYEFNGSKAVENGISERANDVFDRYASIMGVTEHGLSDAELNAVIDAHWSHAFMQADLDINLDWNVSECIEHEGLGEKWKIDGPALVEKLKAMSQVQRVLVIELIEKRRNEAA